MGYWCVYVVGGPAIVCTVPSPQLIVTDWITSLPGSLAATLTLTPPVIGLNTVTEPVAVSVGGTSLTVSGICKGVEVTLPATATTWSVVVTLSGTWIVRPVSWL